MDSGGRGSKRCLTRGAAAARTIRRGRAVKPNLPNPQPDEEQRGGEEMTGEKGRGDERGDERRGGVQSVGERRGGKGRGEERMGERGGGQGRGERGRREGRRGLERWEVKTSAQLT